MKPLSLLVSANNIASYMPVVSTAVNLVDLFQKCVILPLMNENRIYKNHYYTYLSQKSFPRCILLLIPGLGNIVIGLYDFLNRHWSNKDYVLQAVTKDGLALKHASYTLKDNEDVVLAAVKQNGAALCFASYSVKDKKEIVLAAVTQNGSALGDASNALKNNEEVVLAAVTQNGCALKYASDTLKKNKKIALAAVTQIGLAHKYVNANLQKDPDILKAVSDHTNKAGKH